MRHPGSQRLGAAPPQGDGAARSTRLLSGLLSGSLAAAVMVLQRINTGYTF